MKRKILSIFLTLVLVLTFSLVTAVPAAAAVIIVGPDYPTIQAAIDAAAPDDTISVTPGTYFEHIRIDKALTIRSTEGPERTIIDGFAYRYIVEIYHSDVTFEGFTVTNPTYEGGADATGILVGAYLGESVSNVHILNNVVTQVRNGTGGTPSGYGATGINIGRAPLSNVVISGNTIKNIKNPDGASIDHTCGISVWDGAENVEILNNTISDIKYNGILLQRASNVLIEDNPMITECETGIRVEPFEEGAVSDVTVNSNNFANNFSIQVFDDAFEVLDIEDVLVDNIFDRAVTVDHASLLHIIWSKIQGGVDAASSGDSVIVAKGIYDEVVLVDESVNLLGANAGVCAGVDPGGREAESVIDNTVFVIQANGVTIDGFKFNGGGPYLGENAGIYMAMSTSGHTIANNILVGPGKDYSPAYRGILVGTFNVVNNFSTTITCNDIHGWKTGVTVNPTGEDAGILIQSNSIRDNFAGIGCDGSGVTILGNDFTNNDEGFGCAGNNVVAHNNNFVGNVAGVNSWAGAVIDAENNWWDSPSGPTHASNTYTAPADDTQGDAINNMGGVSDWVDFVPWLDGPYLGGESFAPVSSEDGSFSSIQAAVNAAQHTTILLLPGTYTEGVTVDVEGITIKGVSLDAIVDGGFVLKANNITIDGLTIKNGYNDRAILTRAETGGTYGSKGHRIINNDIIGVKWAINIVACDAEPVNILVDSNKIHDGKIAIMLEGYGTTITNNELYDNSKSGIEVERSCDNDISRNDIHGNGQYGIRIGKVATTGNAINFNNIWGNGEYGVLIDPINPSTVNALFNWWGDVTGPEQVTTNPDGKGNPVSDRVDYIPWLTRVFETVLTEGIGYYGFPMVELRTGWNLLSTPFALDPGETIGEVDYPGCNTWAEFANLNDLPLYTGVDPEYVNAYYFDGELQNWGQVTGDYVLLPCDAIYVRMASPDIAAVLASPQRWMPTKTLHKDWNLVGLSWMPPEEEFALHAKLALKSVEVVGSLTGYTQVVSPWTNQQPWTYIAGMEIVTPGPGWMQLTKGYWVFMENGPDVLAGSWSTPMGLP